MDLSKGVTPLQRVASWADVCMHAPGWICTPARTHKHVYPPLYSALTPGVTPPRHGAVCVLWEAGVCHLVWLRQERVETAKRETKLDVASVSRVASPWVRWAILIEGKERSPDPLVHKPLYRIPHHVFVASWDCGGSVIQWQVWEKDVFVGKRQLLNAVKIFKSSLNSISLFFPLNSYQKPQ